MFFVEGGGFHVVAAVRRFVIRALGDLEINLGAKARTQRAIDVARNGRGQVSMGVRAARDYYHGQTRINHRGVRSKQPEPRTLSNASAGLSGDGLFRTI